MDEPQFTSGRERTHKVRKSAASEGLGHSVLLGQKSFDPCGVTVIKTQRAVCVCVWLCVKQSVRTGVCKDSGTV